MQHAGDYGDLRVNCVFAGGISIVNAPFDEVLSDSVVMQRVGENCNYQGTTGWEAMSPVAETVCAATRTFRWKKLQAAAFCLSNTTGQWRVGLTAFLSSQVSQPPSFSDGELSAGFTYLTDSPETCPDALPRSIESSQTLTTYIGTSGLPILEPGNIIVT